MLLRLGLVAEEVSRGSKARSEADVVVARVGGRDF
jgi:hypothetical protein